ncbi:hypothetical protein Tco_0927161 [Tanacetum coccineum]
MKNANPFGPPVPPNIPCDHIVQELDELLEISAIIDFCLENIDHNQLMIPPPSLPEFHGFENIGAHIESELSKVVMAKPFKDLTHLEDDFSKGLILFSRIWDTNIFQMPRTIPKLKNLGHYQWSRIPPFLVLSDKDRMSGLKYSYEKNKLIYKGSLNLGPEYQVDEEMKEWLIRGHVRMHEAN